MKQLPVAVIRTLPETVGEDAARALRLCTSRRAPSKAAELLVVERGHGAFGATSSWALEALVAHRRAAHADASARRVVSSGPDAGRSVEPSLDRTLAALDLRVEAIAAEGEHRVDVELPWLRGRRGTDLTVDARLAGRDLWWAGPLQLDRRFGFHGAVWAALSLVARPEELDDGDPQTMIEAMRLFEAAVAGHTFLVDATICTSADGSERPQVHNLVLAGRDPVLVDAVGARILGFDPARVAWLRSLAEGLRRDFTPGSIPLLGGAFDTGNAGLRGVHGGRAVAPIRRRKRRRTGPFDPRRWWGRTRAARWESLYAKTPWGRLRDHARRTGRTTGEDRP